MSILNKLNERFQHSLDGIQRMDPIDWGGTIFSAFLQKTLSYLSPDQKYTVLQRTVPIDILRGHNEWYLDKTTWLRCVLTDYAVLPKDITLWTK